MKKKAKGFGSPIYFYESVIGGRCWLESPDDGVSLFCIAKGDHGLLAWLDHNLLQMTAPLIPTYYSFDAI